MVAIADSKVLITGANGGLGKEFIRQALALGARRVYATARVPQAHEDSRIVPLELDVTQQASIDAAARSAPDVDIVINNAGRAGRARMLDIPLREIRDVFDTMSSVRSRSPKRSHLFSHPEAGARSSMCCR